MDHAAVDAAQPQRVAPLPLQQVDKVLVRLSGQHHLHDAQRFGVHVAQPADKPALFADGAQRLVDLRPAAVHQHNADADERQQNQIAHDGRLELAVDHGVSAIFDDDHLAAVRLDIRQSLREDLRLLLICNLHLNPSPAVRCGNRR